MAPGLAQGGTAEPTKFVVASGQDMGHYGSKIAISACSTAGVMSLGFEVRAKTRHWVAARRIEGRGNEVHSGEDDGWIRNASRGTEISLDRKGRCCMLRVNLISVTAGFIWQV